ncbi:single-stranded DNA-binding protein [Streptomyces melanogenes]|uniref:Single-stranded DNA-binding protein n=1 Tax=Streptomyces melanogenes TaxID=67326 RepID=A0ABZ1XIZ3_9ACTN|nr:single-stranded DNA-binding protein [Streptomyces melanogenes]
MNDTLVTLVGNAATRVEYRETATGGVARFRLAVTPRWFDRQKSAWVDGHSSFYTVWAWRTLGLNLASSVAVGEPLVVHGRLRVRDEDQDGQRRFSADVEAISVGHDLTRGTSAFRRVVKADPSLTEPPKGPAWEGGSPLSRTRTAVPSSAATTAPGWPETGGAGAVAGGDGADEVSAAGVGESPGEGRGGAPAEPSAVAAAAP